MNWSAQAGSELLEYAKTNPRFMAEDVWEAIEAKIGAAPNPNMKGMVFQRVLITEGLVVKVGHAKSKSPKSKGHEYPVYKSLLCKDQDETVTVQARLAELNRLVNLRKLSLIQALRKAYEIGASAYVE